MIHRQIAFLSFVIALYLCCGHLHADPTPSTQQAVSRQQLIDDLTKCAIELDLPENADLNDSFTREQLGKKVIPLAKRALATIDQLSPVGDMQSLLAMKLDWVPLLVLFGDKPTRTQIEKDASDEGERAVFARISLARGRSRACK